jgi:hypothetical protein
MNAIVAKETGRRVRRRRIFEVKEWDEEEEDGVERSGVWRWWLVIGMVGVGVVVVVVGSNHQIGLHTQKQQQQVLCFVRVRRVTMNHGWMKKSVVTCGFTSFNFVCFCLELSIFRFFFLLVFHSSYNHIF